MWRHFPIKSLNQACQTHGHACSKPSHGRSDGRPEVCPTSTKVPTLTLLCAMAPYTLKKLVSDKKHAEHTNNTNDLTSQTEAMAEWSTGIHTATQSWRGILDAVRKLCFLMPLCQKECGYVTRYGINLLHVNNRLKKKSSISKLREST